MSDPAAIRWVDFRSCGLNGTTDSGTPRDPFGVVRRRWPIWVGDCLGLQIFTNPRDADLSPVSISVTAHDGFTLRDLVSYDHKHNEANLEDNRDGSDNNISANYGVEGETDDREINAVRQRQMRNLLTTCVLASGVPMISGGDEFGRTQHGNNNAYCQDNDISWYNWNWQAWQSELVDFTASVIHLRQNNPAFRRQHFFAEDNSDAVKDVLWWHPSGRLLAHEDWNDPGQLCLGMAVSNDSPAGGSGSFLVVMNANNHAVDYHLPETFTEAQIEIHTCDVSPDIDLGVLHLPPRSSAVLTLP